MIILERFAFLLGKYFMIIGGIAFTILLASLIVYAACRTLVRAIAAFWVTKNVNSRIREYGKNREKFLEWLEKEKKKEDCNGKT